MQLTCSHYLRLMNGSDLCSLLQSDSRKLWQGYFYKPHYMHMLLQVIVFSRPRVFEGNISEACSSFCTMQDRIVVLFLLRKSPVGVAILRKLCRNNLVVCWLIAWSVQVTPLSSCGTNGFHRTTDCCMPLSGNEITLLVAAKTQLKTRLPQKIHRNIMRTLSHATNDTSKNDCERSPFITPAVTLY